jgi:phosphoribosylformylglycinamidine cyclo-ligase
MKVKKPITYSKSGVNYKKLDSIKKTAQNAASQTKVNLEKHGFSEVSETRGESAFVWQQNDVLMASVIEGLGTKNLVADAMYKLTGKSYYDVIAEDTVATIINDLISVGAIPLVIHAYWALGKSDLLEDEKRMTDLVKGWQDACDLAGVTWGGGETPTLKGIVEKNVIEFGGSAVGIISAKKNLIIDKKLKAGDRIILVKSNGVNANGISLARAVAKKLPQGYGTKLKNGQIYGEALLTKSNIYAKLVQNLLEKNVDIHYISNITGHGLKKIMRGRPKFTYILEKIFESQEVFNFIQENVLLSDAEMYQIYNMGQDYAIFVSAEDVQKTLEIIQNNKFEAIDAGVVENGEKQLIIKPKNLIFKGDTLDLR